jgi:mRNA interferase RelE/StbE
MRQCKRDLQNYHPETCSKTTRRSSSKKRKRLISAIRLLADEPRPSGVKKLKIYDKTYRIRVGDYRIIYNIEDQEKLILILNSIHRKDA